MILDTLGVCIRSLDRRLIKERPLGKAIEGLGVRRDRVRNKLGEWLASDHAGIA